MTKIDRRWGYLVLSVCLTACGGEGGASGTGITGVTRELPGLGRVSREIDSTVSGNVLRQTLRSSSRVPAFQERMMLAFRELLPWPSDAHAVGEIGPVCVSLEGRQISSTVGLLGAFSLQGDFEGPIVLRFERPFDGLVAEISMRIPRGGSLELHDVFLNGVTGIAIPQVQELRFDGLVDETNCQSEIALLSGRLDTIDEIYSANLDIDSIKDEAGRRLGCAELRAGSPVLVEGNVQPDGSLDDVSLTTIAPGEASSTPPGSEPPPTIFEELETVLDPR